MKKRQIIYVVNDNNCYICTSHGKDIDGYIRMRHPETQKMMYLHRLIYEQKYGKIPKGICVCHKCDNPSCINIEHLFLGTTQENTKDKMNKNRHRVLYGENSPNSKLTEKQVIEIRNIKDMSQKKIAEKYGICQSHVKDIKKYKRWKHVS